MGRLHLQLFCMQLLVCAYIAAARCVRLFGIPFQRGPGGVIRVPSLRLLRRAPLRSGRGLGGWCALVSPSVCASRGRIPRGAPPRSTMVLIIYYLAVCGVHAVDTQPAVSWGDFPPRPRTPAQRCDGTLSCVLFRVCFVTRVFHLPFSFAHVPLLVYFDSHDRAARARPSKSCQAASSVLRFRRAGSQSCV